MQNITFRDEKHVMSCQACHLIVLGVQVFDDLLWHRIIILFNQPTMQLNVK